MTRVLLFTLLFIAHGSFAQSGDSGFGKPIFWYGVSDPWAMFMGAQGPPFILYSNNKILFWKDGGYKVTQLDEREKWQLIDELNLRDTLFQKSRFYNATNPDPFGEIMATDNPSYSVFVNLDTLVRVSVYGSISSKDYRKRFPSKVLKIHDFVLHFDVEEYATWIPEKIEVMLSNYSHSPDIPIPWPRAWPDLNSPDARRQDGYITSLFLDKKHLKQLIKLIKKRREKQAFEINGAKYFVGYRFPIPGLYQSKSSLSAILLLEFSMTLLHSHPKKSLRNSQGSFIIWFNLLSRSSCLSARKPFHSPSEYLNYYGFKNKFQHF